MAYKDLAEHIDGIFAVSGFLFGLIAWLAWYFARLDRVSISRQLAENKEAITATNNLLENRIKEMRNELFECIKRIEFKIDSSQNVHTKCNAENLAMFMTKGDFIDFKVEIRAMMEEIRRERREAWNRQETVNNELFKGLNGHSHNDKTGKTVRTDIT